MLIGDRQQVVIILSSQGIKWLLFVDSDSEVVHKNKNKGLRLSHPMVVPLSVPDSELRVLLNFARSYDRAVPDILYERYGLELWIRSRHG